MTMMMKITNLRLPPMIPLIKAKHKHKPSPSSRPRRNPSPRQTRSARGKQLDDDNSEYTYGNYNPNKQYIYHVDYCDTDKSYEYIPIDISGANMHSARFSLPRGVNLSFDNLCNIVFSDFLLDEIVG